MGVVLVTGAAGFAGGHLLEHLAPLGLDLVGWARSEPPSGLAGLARWQRVDLLDAAQVRQAIAGLRPSQVYHCAGVPHVAGSWSHSATSLAGNIRTTHHLFDALRRADVRARILLPGSATVYAPSDAPIREDSGVLAPASPYALSKLGQEMLGGRGGAEDGLDVVMTRSFNHTGPRQTPAFVAPSMARQVALIERGALEPTIRVGNLSTRRDITDVRDVVRAYALLMARGAPGTIYNVASGVGRSIQSVLDALVARARVPVRVEIDTSRLRAQDTPALVGDRSRLTRATGWEPEVPFDRMLDDLLAYWRAHAEP
jgi:GDP-4-dehydro-6-deoxy-D-mannose reductase